MSIERIQAILAEISKEAIKPRVQELTAELGALLTALLEAQTLALGQHALITLDQQQATDDRLLSVDRLVVVLRSELKMLKDDVNTKHELVSGRLHTLANYVMGLENKVDELALLLEISVSDDDITARS
jgi:hypothetical protein